MTLSNNLISEFAKITNDKNEKSEATVYGTTVSHGGKIYVIIDGSDVLTPVVTTSEIKAGERVTVMIKDHTATIMGNITNPSASTETVGKILDEYDIIVAKIGNFEILIADKVTTEQLQAEIARIDEALIGKASIEQLEAVNAKIENLDVSELEAEIARIDKALIDKAEITDLEAIYGDISILESDVANITTLVGGNLTMDNIQSLILTSSKVTVDNAFIKDAMIDRVSASKLYAGVINTDLVTIQSEDGSMNINGTLQQFKDKDGNVRIQIGKDASGDFTFALYGADGQGQLINQNGITASAISDGLIVDNMVADNANISGSKLDIATVVEEINDGTTTIRCSKVLLDDKNQTLDVAFDTLSTTVTDTQSKTESNSTSISTMQGQIDTVISNTEIVIDGETVLLKDAYSNTVQTVDSMEQTILSHTTQIDGLDSTVSTQGSSISQLQSEMTLKVEQTDITKAVDDIAIGGKNILRYSKFDTNNTTNGWINFGGDTGEGLFGTRYKHLNNTNDASTYNDLLRQVIYRPNDNSKYLKPDTWYTVSFYLKGTGKIRTHIYPSLANVNVKSYCDGVETTTIADGRVDWNLTSEWTRHVHTFKTVSLIPSVEQYFLFRLYGGNEVYICAPQLEEGNKVTDWDVNADDINADVDTKISQAKAEIKLETDQIALSVEKVETSVNELTYENQNLLLNSSMSINFDKWLFDGTGQEIISLDGVSCAHIQGALNTTKTVYQSVLDKLDVNDLSQTYTFSADVRVENFVAGTTNPYVALYFSGAYNNDGTSTWLGAQSVIDNSSISAQNGKGWVRISWTVKFAAVPISMRAYVYLRDFTGDVYFKNLKLEKGSKATYWTPAPEDHKGNLKVGGTNLIANSAPTSVTGWSTAGGAGGWATSLVDCVTAPYGKAIRGTYSGTTATQGGIHKGVISKNKLVNGEEYTLSAWVRASKSCRIKFMNEMMINENYISVTTQWAYFTFTCKIDTSMTYSSDVFYVYAPDVAQNMWFEVHSLKLEKGNVATTWSPAPEDVDSSIEAVKSSLTVRADSIEAKVTQNGQDIASLELSLAGIDLTGYVTFNDLSGSGTTTINGNNITTGYISGDRIQGGVITAVEEIRFVDGARIFGNSGAYGYGFSVSASEVSFLNCSSGYIAGKWSVAKDLIVDGSILSDNDTVVIGQNTSVSGDMTIAGSIYGAGTIQLYTGNIWTPVGSANRDYIRFGTTLMSSDSSYGMLVTDTSGAWSTLRCGTVVANGTTLSSDKRFKTDIKYVDVDIQTIGETELIAPNTNISYEDMHNFIENLPMASYRLVEEFKNGIDRSYYGFIAQDILYTKVGSELIEYDVFEVEPPVFDEKGNVIQEGVLEERLKYSENKFIAFICGALKEEIKKRKELEGRLNNLENLLNE